MTEEKDRFPFSREWQSENGFAPRNRSALFVSIRIICKISIFVSFIFLILILAPYTSPILWINFWHHIYILYNKCRFQFIEILKLVLTNWSHKVSFTGNMVLPTSLPAVVRFANVLMDYPALKHVAKFFSVTVRRHLEWRLFLLYHICYI
jgi:hypothetical protein